MDKKLHKAGERSMRLILMYIGNMTSYMTVALPIYLIFRLAYIKIMKKEFKVINEILLVTFVLYIVGLASQTIIPHWNIGVDSNTGRLYFNITLSNPLSSINLVPFKTLKLYLLTKVTRIDNWSSLSLLNISANILLFSPLGTLIPLIWRKWDSFYKIFFLGFSITCFIEVFQICIGRSCDIDDVILNTLGVLVGFALFKILKLCKIDMFLERLKK